MISVSGVVTNNDTGNPEAKVTVYESTSGIGTITNKQGYYRLLLRTGKREIEFSGTGFTSVKKEFELVADTVLTVELKPVATEGITAEPAGVADLDQDLTTGPVKQPAKRKKK